MKILITGISGMAGSHLAEHLLDSGKHEIHGTIRWRSSKTYLSGFEDQLILHHCDLRDSHSVSRLLKVQRPDRIFHLAAQSSVSTSFDAPEHTITNNITCQLNILEALRDLELPDTRILIAGSSEQYGLVAEKDLPADETTPFHPLSPYAVSKVSQDLLGFQYYKSFHLHVIRVRSFNHTGPRQNDTFALSSFARQIAEIEAGLKPPVLYVGNLVARRDFTDFRDIAKAYELAIEQCIPGEAYNIGSGCSRSMEEYLNILLSHSSREIDIRQDTERTRPSDVPHLVCNFDKFNQLTQWKPQISIEQTLKDLLDDWRNKYKCRPDNSSAREMA